MNTKEQFVAIKKFVDDNFLHFNAGVVKRAAQAYVKHLDEGNKMFLAMAGAMSTAELGITLAEMIRQDKIHAISCTGANLEEDLFNLVAHNHYENVPNYRHLTAQDEEDLLKRQLNRVTDVCIPEEEAMIRIEAHVFDLWQKAEAEGKRYFPYEIMYQLIRSGIIEKYYQIDPRNSWMLAACEKNIPIFVPGWEDSTLGNVFLAKHLKGMIKDPGIFRNGIEAMGVLLDWYRKNTAENSVGFFQIGGGIAGDYPICVVPIITQDLKEKAKVWSYFCQISDSTTSYGSYSGAVPNEKITWGKLNKDTPNFIIESDATIVAPLIFGYILGQ
ncbi:MAG: deoxyhypusine synthase family protein [Bacteroidota bacterium]